MKFKLTSQIESDKEQKKIRDMGLELFKKRPMTDEELLVNPGLFIRSGVLAKLLFLNEIYSMIIDIPGHVIEFGVWYGQSLTVFENLRAIYEPYNYSRKIVGFDTFEGYPEISINDKESEIINVGNYKLENGYEDFLIELVDYHEKENVMKHIKKHEIVKGDILKTFPLWLKNNPSSVFSLLYLDVALYEPTKNILENAIERLMPGGVIVFDEFNNENYPGETKAVLETLDFDKFLVSKSKFLPDRVIFQKK